MEGQRFNAVRNGDGFNCPRCHRARSLVEIDRRGGLWECREDARGPGCFALFRLEARVDREYDDLVRVVEGDPVRAAPAEIAARRERFFR